MTDTVPTGSSTDAAMHRLTVAAGALINDYADTRVRGYLKEHPDLVQQRLGAVAEMVDAVRDAVARERIVGTWGALDYDPAGELWDQVAEWAAHTCNCPYCLNASA